MRNDDFVHDPPVGAEKSAEESRSDALWTWVEGHHRRVLVAGIAFQILFLLGMVAIFARPHVDPLSRVVLLRVVPVDPRDFLRGDYVILSYEVSRVAGDSSQAGRPVYVALAPDDDGRHYHADGVSDVPFDDGRLFLRGTRESWGRVRFGIESYYVQEGEGLGYEAAVRDRRLSAEVAVAPDGTAALRGLVVEGQAG
ncbi:MAG: GDYXXLXY domain-containing protein [Isosphaeraceae bacterium]